jgi:electron-transferring-flavoprotein dehydrogenase
MEEFGGAFIYAMPNGLLSIGFVSGLDYKDPMFDPHLTFQRFKLHPFVSSLLEGGKMVRYGAKALPEGGWHTVPRVHMDGALIAGDAAGFMNSMRLKGIHLAMRTGMLAAETAFDAVRAGDVSARRLAAYQDAINASEVKRELYPVRNVHQAFEHRLVAGVLLDSCRHGGGGSRIDAKACRLPAHGRSSVLRGSAITGRAGRAGADRSQPMRQVTACTGTSSRRQPLAPDRA